MENKIFKNSDVEIFIWIHFVIFKAVAFYMNDSGTYFLKEVMIYFEKMYIRYNVKIS